MVYFLVLSLLKNKPVVYLVYSVYLVYLVVGPEINGERLKLQLWDTAGHERYRLVTNSYCRGAHGVILVYDITNVGTFTNLRW